MAMSSIKGVTDMYYISSPNSLGLSRVVKRLSDFPNSLTEEGSEWHVRKRRKLKAFDSVDVYFIKGGKLVRCPQKTSVVVW